MVNFKSLLNNFLDKSGKEANFLHKHLLFGVYFDVVTGLCDEYVDFREGVIPLKIHNFISEYDTTLIVAEYHRSLFKK